MNKTIALVDDEEDIRTVISMAIKKEGWTSYGFSDGESALTSFKDKLPDLIVLDIMLPGISGLDLCKEIRKISEEVPIIFVTSKDEELDLLVGLELGADDYLCKPFSIKELITRMKVLFRRISVTQNKTMTKKLIRGNLQLDSDSIKAYINDKDLFLTVTEFRLLHSLAKEPGVVKTRDILLKESYSEDLYVGDRTIDNHIRRLRKKIDIVEVNSKSIETVYRMGYRYCLE